MAELINPSSYNDFTLQTLMTPDGITRLNSILSQLSQNIAGDTENVRVFQGVGTPEASVAAGVGSLYMRTDGGTDTSIYRKESGSGDTGWVAIKAPASLPLSVANGGTGSDLSATAQGYILYFSATGVLSVLAPGTSGQYLKTQGAAANPVWGTVFENYAAGTILLANSDNQVETVSSGTTETKAKEIYIRRSGTLTISFDGKRFNSDAPGTARIYRNGVAVGTARTLTDSYQTWSEDISGWSTGDLCQVYTIAAGGTGNQRYVKSFRVFATIPTIEQVTYDGGSSLTSGKIISGTGAPANDTGNQGDIYLRTDGGATTTLYVKTGASTWTAK